MADFFSGMTDTGRLRSNNEDAFIAMEVGEQLICACVIDGVGGYEGGEVAADIAKNCIVSSLQQPLTDIQKTLKEAIRLANDSIFEAKLKGSENNRMACVLTLAIADTAKNSVHYIHIGDTRLYLYREGSLVKLTKDHSFVGFLEDSGRMDERMAMTHPRRNEINKALGFDQYIEQRTDYWETGVSPFLPGDMILLCSDGLTDMIGSEAIISILSGEGSLHIKCQRLIDAANEAGGKDNVTVVLVQNHKQRQQHVALRPTINNNSSNSVDDQPTKNEQVEAETIDKKKTKWLPIALAILGAIILALIIWMMTRQDRSNEDAVDTVSAMVEFQCSHKMMTWH